MNHSVNHPVHHLTEDELYNYVFDQTLPADNSHLTICPICRQTIGELTRLAKVLTSAHLSQPSPAQSERCVALFTQRTNLVTSNQAASDKSGRGIN